MTILKVTEVKETLVIGKFYLVPCVTMPVDIEGFKAGKPIPVIGNLHSDPLIRFDHLHYHYDYRFIKEEISLASVVAVRSSYDNKDIYPKDFFWRRRKCYRNNICFPERFCPILEPEFAQCRLTNGKCPHKNFPLNSWLPDSESNVICPGHGLKWNLATGKLVSRLA